MPHYTRIYPKAKAQNLKRVNPQPNHLCGVAKRVEGPNEESQTNQSELSNIIFRSPKKISL